MKKGKWLKRLIIVIVVLALIGTGAVFGVRYLKKRSGSAVEVYNVSDINAADWIGYGDGEGASGTVLSDVSQSVYVPDDKVVEKVFVEEGDKVKVGDKLVSYDTTLLELDQELQELTVMELEMEIKAAEADLAKLKNTTPVAKSNRDDTDSGSSFLDALESSNLWDSDDDEARLISDERSMRMAQEGEKAEAAEEKTESAAEPNTEAQKETAANPETEQKTATDEAETKSSELESETQADTEWILDGESEGIVENLTPEDLKGDVKDDSAIADIMNSMNGEAPKLNQSLKEMLTNIRIKEKTEEQGEVLLLDTVQYEANSEMTASITGNQITVIPHFAETQEYRFVKRNTYVMYIQGIKLKSDLAGKIYGTAVIDGNDYPEIGGFTCVQDMKTGRDDVVKLILAFHEGLDQQQEGDGRLADMYLELHLNVAELIGDRLFFVVSEEKEENTEILLEKPVTVNEAETESNTETNTENDTEPESELNTEAVSPKDTEEESEQEISEEEIESESTSETESEKDTEPESETETENLEPISEFTVTVNWNHGTNDKSRWPKELSLLFYEKEADAEPVFTALIQEGTKESETEATEDTSEDATEDATEGIAGNVSENTSENALESTTEVNVQTWEERSVPWSLERANPAKYHISLYVPNYIPTIQWDNATSHLTIQMNYLEPEETPIQKLDPLSELTFFTGAEGLYYKGSGTAEDPYVFFCTDGATIRNSFINWVLGFDELGTTRISDGYCVRLEIRESDHITGAFIRSVGLDGTIPTEVGYDSTIYWIFTSENGMVKYQEEVPGDAPSLGGGLGDDLGWDDSGDGYTAEELSYAIAEKEREIRQLRSDEKKANLELKKYEKEMEESVVVSSVNGVVQSSGGSENSDALLVVASEGGMYVKSTVSEMNLDKVEKGQVVTCTSWETGSTFTATITQIDTFPTTNNDYYWSGGNVNSSSYPLLAVVDDPEIVSEYESVSVQLPLNGNTGGSGIYLEKAYIRSENGQSYVYIADEKGLLKKQYVRTGGNSYGYIEIKEGLNRDDKIAFPYGKNVKPGAKTKDAYGDED